MSDKELREIVERLSADPSVAGQWLPPEELEEYRRCQQSIVDAAVWIRPRRTY